MENTRLENRFLSLDSCRGVCAFAVALYHFMVFSHLTLLPFVRHAFLSVDFFFVLSGFVISASYGQRLRRGYKISRFILLRLGRIYPLHLALMCPFALILLFKIGDGSVFWASLITNIFMVHGLGLYRNSPQIVGGLNFPSWSISAELFAYIAYTLVITLPYARFILSNLFCVAICPLLILIFCPDLMNSTFDFGILRCFYGFALGVLCFELHTRFDWTSLVQRSVARTLIEVSVAGAVFTLITILDETCRLTVLMPVVFAGLVLVFARDAGGLSRVLSGRPWQVVGAWSYSIYMTHALVQVIVRASGFALQHFTHLRLFTPMRLGSKVEDLLGTTLWQGDIAIVVIVTSTLVLAALTHRFIEEPGRLWSRKVAGRPWSIQGVKAEPVVPADGPRL